MKKLTEKQRRFADYFIETGNQTEAAIKAGYSERTARAIGSENLTKPNIRKYIDDRLEELASERIADQREVLETLTRVMRREECEYNAIVVKKADTLSYVDGNGKEREKTVYNEEVEVVETPAKVADVNKAAELLGKRYGIWKEKVEVEDVTPTFVDDIPTESDEG